MSIIKPDNKRFLIVILVIIGVALCMILCLLHILKTLKDNRNELRREISQTDIENNPYSYSVEEILHSFGCKNVNEKYELTENEEENKKIHKVTLSFKYNLYEKDESKEDYFNKIIKALKNVWVNSFELYDESKNIDIVVDQENNIITINGIEDFYNNNSYLEVNNHKELPISNGNNSSLVLNKIIFANWDKSKISLKEGYTDYDENYLYYSNFKINSNDKNINFIVFSKDYPDTVFEDIKVGTQFSKIEQKLGKPTFKLDDEMIGYKASNLYVFFYKDEIVLYPSSSRYDTNNVLLEKKIVDYYNGKIEEDRSLFVKDIIDNYLDFKSEVIKDYVKVSSYLRGIDLLLYDNGTFKIKIYDNYKLKSDLKVLAQSNKVELDYENDSVYLFEKNRVK